MKRLTTNKKEAIIKLIDKGNSPRSISKMYQVSLSSVYYWMKKYAPLRSELNDVPTYKEYLDLSRRYKKACTEVEILQKYLKYTEASLKRRMAFIDEKNRKYSVDCLCDALLVSRGTYRNHTNRNKNKDAWYIKRRQELIPMVRDIFFEYDAVFGAKGIAVILKNQYGISTDRHLVGDLMKEMGLESRHSSRYRDKFLHNYARRVNLLKQKFEVRNKNEVWLTDCKRLIIPGFKKNCICTVEDIFSRKIVGYSFGVNESSELVIAALSKAIRSRKPKAGLIIHSDRGSAYISKKYNAYIASKKFEHSFSNISRPKDNAPMESFNSLLQIEKLNYGSFTDVKGLRDGISNYIEFYNSVRPHSSLAYMSPDKYEEIYSEGLRYHEKTQRL